MILTFLLACPNDPVSTSPTSNADVTVETLFEHDGCTVYRFEDGGRDRYYARCESIVTTSWAESCGKNCTREETIPTAASP